MARYAIESERLLLLPFEPAEATALHALWALPEVRRHLWDDRLVTPEEVDKILGQSEEWFATRGVGLWSVREKLQPEQLLGFGSVPQPQQTGARDKDEEVVVLIVCDGDLFLVTEQRQEPRHGVGVTGDNNNIASVLLPQKINLRLGILCRNHLHFETK
jgi:hypothetical protein